MEQFPLKNKTPETKTKERITQGVGSLLSVAALAAMVNSYEHPDDGGLVFNQTESTTEQPSAIPESQDTLHALGATLDPLPEPPADMPRPKPRPSEWLSLNDFESPEKLFAAITILEAQRLDVDPALFHARLNNLMDFFADVESDHNPQAINPNSSAMSTYQYLTANHSPGKQDGSVHTAIHRMHDILKRHHFVNAGPDHPTLAWAETIYQDPTQIIHTPIKAQQIMVLSDLLQRSGTDGWLQQLCDDDPAVVRQAALDLYYHAHHTDADDAVRDNVAQDIDKYYPIDERPIVLASN